MQLSLDRFWPKVEKTDTCWIWTGSRGPRITAAGEIPNAGYGSLTYKQKRYSAHRFAYLALVGPIPEGMTLDHLCRNPGCVRPNHLQPVTNRTNILRGEGWTARRARATHCINGHEFTKANTRVYKGWRYCRECSKLRCRNYKARLRAKTA